MNVGSLFSGIGGFDLGLERSGMRVVWQVENNGFCNRVLAKHWPDVPRYGDIKTINWSEVEPVDLVCGGFPCQPFSLAGKRAGKADDRYLWPEVVRCLDALRPTWFLGENVPGLINLALDQVCTDLESLGYAVWPVCVPACAVDAPHRRERVWIIAHQSQSLAHSGSLRLEGCGSKREAERSAGLCRRDGKNQDQGVLADAARELPHGIGARRAGREESANSRQWLPEPELGRVAHGVSRRVDRLRGLGNAVVPQIAEILGRAILAHAQSIRLSEEVFS